MTLTLSVSIPDEGKKLSEILFSHFIKPFEAPQRIVKKKYFNFNFNTTFRNARDVKG